MFLNPYTPVISLFIILSSCTFTTLSLILLNQNITFYDDSTQFYPLGDFHGTKGGKATLSITYTQFKPREATIFFVICTQNIDSQDTPPFYPPDMLLGRSSPTTSSHNKPNMASVISTTNSFSTVQCSSPSKAASFYKSNGCFSVVPITPQTSNLSNPQTSQAQTTFPQWSTFYMFFLRCGSFEGDAFYNLTAYNIDPFTNSLTYLQSGELFHPYIYTAFSAGWLLVCFLWLGNFLKNGPQWKLHCVYYPSLYLLFLTVPITRCMYSLFMVFYTNEYSVYGVLSESWTFSLYFFVLIAAIALYVLLMSLSKGYGITRRALLSEIITLVCITFLSVADIFYLVAGAYIILATVTFDIINYSYITWNFISQQNLLDTYIHHLETSSNEAYPNGVNKLSQAYRKKEKLLMRCRKVVVLVFLGNVIQRLEDANYEGTGYEYVTLTLSEIFIFSGILFLLFYIQLGEKNTYIISGGIQCRAIPIGSGSEEHIQSVSETSHPLLSNHQGMDIVLGQDSLQTPSNIDDPLPNLITSPFNCHQTGEEDSISHTTT